MTGQGAWAIGAAVLLVLSTPLAGAWDQLRGDAQHSGVSTLAAPAFDVTASFILPSPLHPGSVSTSPALLPTPHGLVAVLWSSTDGVSCILTRLSPDGAVLANGTLDLCRSGHLVGYDAVTDLVLLCSHGEGAEPVLQARDPLTGELVWGFSPTSLPGIHAAEMWTCRGAALDTADGRVVVPYTGWQGTDAVSSLLVTHSSTNGGVLTTTLLDASSFQNLPSGQGSSPSDAVLQNTPGTGGFHGLAVTLAGDGMVVTGHHCTGRCLYPEAPASGQPPTQESAVEGVIQMAVAWVDQDGDLQGTRLAEPEAMPGLAPGENPAGSRWATAASTEAAVLIGDTLLRLDPSRATPASAGPAPVFEGLDGHISLPAPVWKDSLLVVPGLRSLAALNVLDGSRAWAPWSAGPEAVIEDLMLTDDGRLLILASEHPAGAPPGLSLVILDVDDGRVIQQIPLHDYSGALVRPTRLATLVPTGGDTLLVVDAVGETSRLRGADLSQGLGLSLSDAYPPPGTPVSVEAPDDPEVERFLVSWGDGTHGVVDTGAQATHTFHTVGTYPILVTAVFEDGTTRSSQLVVDVGGTAPAPLNWIQERFAQENQDTTWGVIGVAVALTGGLVAVVGKRARRSRLDGHFQALEELRASHEGDPLQGMAGLEEYRHLLEAELSAGRLDDAQFNMLDLRLRRFQRALRRSFLAPYHGRLDPRFERHLDAAFEDGVVTEAEREILLAGLEAAEGLDEEAKADLARLIAVGG